MKGKEGGTRNRGRRNATKGIYTEATHEQAASATIPKKH
jgi:hypothetical protein